MKQSIDAENAARAVFRTLENHISPGEIRDVIYLGSDTRYIVALEAGDELVVTQQNLETSSMEVLAARGRPVRLAWKRRHVLALAGGLSAGEEEARRNP